METKSIERLRLLHPICRDKAIQAYNQAVSATPVGIHPYIDQTYRSFEESLRDWKKGRNAAGVIINKSEVVSNAKPGFSWHNWSLALDFHLIIDNKDYWPATAKEALANSYWMVVVNIFKQHGFTSGLDFPGKFKDPPHLEYRGGYTLAKLRALHKSKDFIPGDTYLNLA